jgi:hypothetical protein
MRLSQDVLLEIWPAAIRDAPMHRVIDRHEIQFWLSGAIVFYLFDIDIAVLPCHAMHFLQMFDVSVAGPLETSFKQEMDI